MKLLRSNGVVFNSLPSGHHRLYKILPFLRRTTMLWMMLLVLPSRQPCILALLLLTLHLLFVRPDSGEEPMTMRKSVWHRRACFWRSHR